jgi:flagellar basal-body rod protein FlgC
VSLESVFGVGQSALVAQTYRLNVIAENLANAEVAAGTADGAYKGQYPIFKSVLSEVDGSMAMGVKVDGVAEDQRPARSSYEPGNPIADENGFVYMSNVNSVQEMASMMAASRSYQTNIEVMNTAKDLLMRTLTIGQQ